jgi:phage FluMu protein Com
LDTYRCRTCAYSIAHTDTSWERAIETGKCPRCKTILSDFPLPRAEQEKYEKELRNLDERRKSPYSLWCIVASIAFLVGLFTGKVLIIGRNGGGITSFSEYPIEYLFAMLIYGIFFTMAVRDALRRRHLRLLLEHLPKNK